MEKKRVEAVRRANTCRDLQLRLCGSSRASRLWPARPARLEGRHVHASTGPSRSSQPGLRSPQPGRPLAPARPARPSQPGQQRLWPGLRMSSQPEPARHTRPSPPPRLTSPRACGVPGFEGARHNARPNAQKPFRRWPCPSHAAPRERCACRARSKHAPSR